MFEILQLYGIPDKIIAAIKVMYTDTSSTILTPDGETPSFPILAGILQGDTLAPYLFITVVDYVLRISIGTKPEKGYQLHAARSSRYPAKYLTDTDFANDIAYCVDQPIFRTCRGTPSIPRTSLQLCRSLPK